MTADALTKDLQSVNADTIYLVWDYQQSRYLVPSDLNPNGSIMSDLYTGDNQNAQFGVIRATLTHDNIVATPTPAANSNPSAATGIGAYAFTTGATNDLKQAVGLQYGVAASRTLQLNYSISKTKQFGITQTGTASSANFADLYSLAIAGQAGNNK